MTIQRKYNMPGARGVHGKNNMRANAVDSSGAKPLLADQPQDAQQLLANTKLMNEAWHGVWYGAGVGLLLGAYILYFPLWITVSPAWYTGAHWYVIMAITILTSTLVLGVGAAVLGAHVLQRRRLHPF